MLTRDQSHRLTALRITISSGAIVAMTIMTLVQSWQLSAMMTSADIVPFSYYTAKVVSIVATIVCVIKLAQILRIDAIAYRGGRQ